MNKELIIYSLKILPLNVLFKKIKRKIFNKLKVVNNSLIDYDFNKINENNFDFNFATNNNLYFHNIIKDYYLENISELQKRENAQKNYLIINNFLDNKISIFNSLFDLNQFTNTSSKTLDYYSVFNFDFINSHKWENTTKHKIVGNKGFDIKVPWEIGRLQYLSYIATVISVEKDSKLTKELNEFNYNFNEIADKIIDFIVGFIDYNPSSNSIQWLSAMDVSIRLSNLIYIIDTFIQTGYIFDPMKLEKIKKSIFEHIKFVFLHLEWSDGMRANHFYSNITGLFYAFNYLIPKNDTTKQEVLSFKKFLISQIIQETNYQFNADGSNFEDSFPYHTLSFEFLLFNILILNSLTLDEIYKLNKSKIISNKINNKDFEINNEVLQLLYKKLISILEFTNSIQNNGIIPQIGDNDSGTFIHFDILNYNKSSLNYNSLDIKHRLRIFEKVVYSFGQKVGFDHKLKNITTSIVNDDNSNNTSIIKNFEDFGIVINKNKELYFSLKYSKLGQLGKGGHSHNDCLSFVLSLYGEEIFIDAGTYSYTKNYKLRNKFRNNQNHNVLTINDTEQNRLFDRNLDDMFWIYADNNQKTSNLSKIISFNQNLILAEHKSKNYIYKRAFLFNDKNINCKEEINISGNKKVNFLLSTNIKITEIKDSYLVFEKLLNNNKEKIVIKLGIDKNEMLSDNENNITDNLSIDDYEYSPNYLSKINAKKIILSSEKNTINWELSWRLVTLQS